MLRVEYRLHAWHYIQQTPAEADELRTFLGLRQIVFSTKHVDESAIVYQEIGFALAMQSMTSKADSCVGMFTCAAFCIVV